MKLTCIYLLILALIMSLEIKCSSSLLKNKQRMKNKAKAHLKSKKENEQITEAQQMMMKLKKLLSENKAESNQDPVVAKVVADTSDGILDKIKTGLTNIIPNKFNVTVDNAPILINIQEQTGASFESRHDLDYEEYCNVKQGFLSIVIEESDSDKITNMDDKTKKKVLQLKPVFAVLNKETLSLFENENVKSLYKSYNMRFIKPNNIPNYWDKVHCFQVVKGQQKNNKKEAIGDPTKDAKIDQKDILVSLCASDSVEMEKWMAAIKDFHNCDVKAIVTDDKQGLDAEQDNGVGEDEMIELERQAKDQEDIQIIDDALSQVDDIVMDSIGKIKVQKKKHKQDIEEEEDKIDQLEEDECQLTKNLIKKAKEADLQVNMESTLKNMINDFKKPIQDQMNERQDRIIQHEEEQMKAEKRLENNLRDTMTKQAEGFQKNYDSTSCYSDTIIQGGPVEIKKVCSRIFKPEAALVVKELMLCLNPETFCRACCNGFIGPMYEDQRMSCKDKCDASLNKYKQDSEIHMTVFTDNGITDHEFLYGKEKEEADKLKNNLKKTNSLRF